MCLIFLIFFIVNAALITQDWGAVPEGTREGADTTAEFQFVASEIGMKEGARREGVKSVKESAG